MNHLKKKGKRPEGFLEKPVGPFKLSGWCIVILKLLGRYKKFALRFSVFEGDAHNSRLPTLYTGAGFFRIKHDS
ncbi:MAG: hypothetical protein HZB18_08680 [Chloroflexi bacterium]|nr:hypothetical protein [Chloroflexota bacterium]